jgi:uncharacterized protein (TIGR03435 family)
MKSVAIVIGILLFAEPGFEVASVRQNKSDAPAYSNFHLGAGDFYTPNGGLFSATNWPLVTYIFFAYKIQGNQGQSLVSQLPGWVLTDRFDIQARAAGNPTKDEMRLMMRSLLTERFKFAVHTEKRDTPVLAFVLAKAVTGPQLQAHPTDAPCETNTSAAVPKTYQQMIASDFPGLCGGILGLPTSVTGRSRFGGRNVTIGYIADLLSFRVNLGRPMIDATGLSGTFDFLLEFTPVSASAAGPDGPTFEEALREQLGLKLQSRRSPMDMIVVDHLEHLSEN